MARINGFTLIELMIVVAIVGVLAGIGYPSYQSYVLNSHRSEAKAELSQIALLQEQFYLDHNDYALSLPLNATDTGETVLSGWIDESEHYNFALGASSTVDAFSVIATAVGAQANDNECVAFEIDNFGNASAVDSDGDDTTANCWE